MSITTFLRHHSLKLALGFAILGLVCWLFCLSPLTLSLGHLQKVVIYLGLEILYDLLRHWCLKLVKSGCDRLRQISPFVDDFFAVLQDMSNPWQMLSLDSLKLSCTTEKIKLIGQLS
ncbi:hypothetical protein FLX56_20975 [Synechococcus moorigangaii CMS01]|nr:hypothetical protein [Synechococcus moorigangaii CMS01]